MQTRLSVPQGAALTIGAMLGTGVISLPALAAGVAGPASLVAWASLVVLSIPLATTFAALGARHPDGGGVATYARLAFGERASTMVGWAFYGTIGVGAPAAAGFAGAYVADATGGGAGTALATTVAIIALCAVMNWFGLRVSGTAQLAIAGSVALLLAVAVVVALPHAEPGNLTPFAPHGWAAVGPAAALLVWAFAGWEILGSLSAEYRRPSRDIPRATAIAVATVGVLYLGVAYATVAVLGPAPGPAPLSDLLVLGFGEAARPVTTVVAVLLTVGAINVYFAGGSRMGAALARDGGLPAWLATAPGRTPRRSLALVTAIALGTTAVLAGLRVSTDTVVPLATATFSLLYVVGAAAALRLLPRWGLGWWSAAVSLLAALGLLVMTGAHATGPVLVALGGLAWTTWRRRRARTTPPMREQPVLVAEPSGVMGSAGSPGPGCPAGSSS
ncbi:APC family permease [Myceligenerans pegani]|uniref:Amino acid permease n=1 Tax=Myceligenerans pegani TaxID=2776917 RepID=A0ABR9N3V6_9MICO|nr:amino acid permease [Myceligenerans sp. TRM 65318]MBE1878339.1 amino acid permease [Myceligenerans sp. TRM 65318]MBE3020610.1 amino acid permease [Myceligenerans sp. TRM 65318]